MWSLGLCGRRRVAQRLRLSPAGAFLSPWPWEVGPFGPARSVPRSLGRASAPISPKRGVRSPPCSYRPPGRTCALRARTARPLRRLLCVSLWFFVFLAVEGLSLRACTVSAAQREACPNFQASKLPFKICDSVEIPRAARPKGAMEPAGFPRQTVFAKKLPRTVLRCTRR